MQAYILIQKRVFSKVKFFCSPFMYDFLKKHFLLNFEKCIGPTWSEFMHILYKVIQKKKNRQPLMDFCYELDLCLVSTATSLLCLRMQDWASTANHQQARRTRAWFNSIPWTRSESMAVWHYSRQIRVSPMHKQVIFQDVEEFLKKKSIKTELI